MPRNVMDIDQDTRCVLNASVCTYEGAGVLMQQIALLGRAARRNVRLSALFMGSASIAALTLLTSAQAQDASPTPIPDVTVNDTASQPATASEPVEGSEAAGYKPKTVSNFGPFGQTNIFDVPYSVNVMSSALLENTLAATPDDIYRINPLIQPWTPTDRGFGSPNLTLRGFNQSNASGRAEDGMRVPEPRWISIEDKERVELYTGLTSFLYGANNVGGLLNYVYKRPTATPLANITIGDYGNLAGFIHGDFGGPIDKEGQFGYRLNIVGQTGDLPVDFQQNQRSLVSGALSWHINNDTLLEVLGSHQYVRFSGNVPFWSFATKPNGASLAFHPSAPDSTKNFAQSWTHSDTQTDRIAVDFSSKLNEIFTFRTSYAYYDNDQPYASGSNNFVADNSGKYRQFTFLNVRENGILNTGYAFLDAEFSTFSIQHKFTTGFSGYHYRARYADADTPTLFLFGLNFNTPTYVIQPPNFNTAITGPMYTQYTVANSNFFFGDEIKFNEYLSALVGANYVGIKQDIFDFTVGSAHMLTSQYDKSLLTPTFSLIGKPLPWLSTYATYSQALEQGAAVPISSNVIYTNAGQVFSPTVSTEYEVGAKADIHGMLLTAALFRINKALQIDVTNSNGTHTIIEDGRQVHSGLELTATGNIWEGFRIYGGMTLLDPRIARYQADPTLDGKQPQNVANILAKVTAEYDLPFAPGLTLTGGIYYIGSQAVDVQNTEFLPSFTTEDIGIRYRGRLPSGQEAVFRLNVSNLTNKSYWLTSNYVGSPRTVAMSAQIKF